MGVRREPLEHRKQQASRRRQGRRTQNGQMQTVPLVMERKHESLEMEQQWPLKGQGLRLTGPMSLFHLPEHTA